ncbi:MULTISPECIES: AAA family ATPase [Pseudomonas]|uniref:Uncharacterized protein n=1 Tax=Pseudomonas fulva TaxID=47880 RepID=A0A0D0L2J9_9PSED|nr:MULTISPECIES: AAA family ATPase [Pseudomonas]KIQ03920.1 hypothetical protein RU08_06075 [Pseudomonas fulva]
MSKAGIQSNRGDGYQTLVAFDWALSVLSDPDYKWLEVDSATSPVDDVVIEKANGSKIYCQCKKNQTNFKAWSVSDLSDELVKALEQLTVDPSADIRFYSRSNFGDLAALREYSTNYADESSYKANLGSAHEETNSKLEQILVAKGSRFSSYDFLSHINFEVSDNLERMNTKIHERLRQLVTNCSSAYSKLWTRIDHLGMRTDGNGQSIAVQHRISKESIKELLDQAGSILSPSMDVAEIRLAFESVSTIGRAWRRDIGGHYVSSVLVERILEEIKRKPRSLLVTGLPGAGKTCVLLTLQERLENLAISNSAIFPLFIQSREFADFATTQERAAQGLPEHWVERVARLAEQVHVVVVVDSLDVLSIAREHNVLQYFLAQIDRLSLISNVTIVTACRDFDRQFDRRIAQRKWSSEFRCEPLDWKLEIAPLLGELGIDVNLVDVVTRQLISNPRELALYVELAQKSGSFNIVTSHALAQRYLVTTVQSENALGDKAMQAIEALAVEMLKIRSLAVSRQRFTASQEILNLLLSHNVLRETQDAKLIFGHQTLLDVLVISDARRQGVTLNDFIQSLSPVPFVRPSIRSFVNQLASDEDRKVLRRQLRAVLTGSHAFHIRRLVAECFAEQSPVDDDWSLIRDLRSQHRDVFQVIYGQAKTIEWYRFWFKYLVPMLKDMRDTDGLLIHVNYVQKWIKEDSGEVLNFWSEMLALDWMPKEKMSRQLEFALSEIELADMSGVADLLMRLIELPQAEHSALGRALAKCVKKGAVNDEVLWQYIARDIKEEDVLGYDFDGKLRCQSYDFGNSKDDFLTSRMLKSTALLDVAIADLERWSRLKGGRYGRAPRSYRCEFLDDSSYIDAHKKSDFNHSSGLRILLNAVEAGIVHQAFAQGEWWNSNRNRLCFSEEGALRYFAIQAFIKNPGTNLDLIGQMLSDTSFLDSELSYELGSLLKISFSLLDAVVQDSVQDALLLLNENEISDTNCFEWIVLKRACMIITIPNYLRNEAAQKIVRLAEDICWPLVRQPHIKSWGGMVGAPFSHEIFLDLSDAGVLRLIAHYNGYTSNCSYDFLNGGEEEVGRQLGSAASLAPSRFMKFLTANRAEISSSFRNEILDGVATYLAQRYGNLQKNANWSPREDPESLPLALEIIEEIESHQDYWHHNRAASKAIEGCAYIVTGPQEVLRLTTLAMSFSDQLEGSSISGESVDLLTTGINMTRGNAAETVMILANNLLQRGEACPDKLIDALRVFASDESPAIRALILSRLPYLQSKDPELGWELFDLATRSCAEGLWSNAEHCLYYAYHNRFDLVRPRLAQLMRDGVGKDLVTWGRISALAALSKRIDSNDLLVDLASLNSADAWRGAASVWGHPENAAQHRDECINGLSAGASTANPNASVVANKITNLFRESSPFIGIPAELIRRLFVVFQTDNENSRRDVYGFEAWLNTLATLEPNIALEIVEIYLDFVRRTTAYLYDHDNHLMQLLTRLFAQAEEQEESDDGAMLRRVVTMQDTLLALGVAGVSEWLKVAERP